MQRLSQTRILLRRLLLMRPSASACAAPKNLLLQTSPKYNSSYQLFNVLSRHLLKQDVAVRQQLAPPCRQLWSWLNSVFNRYDPSRVEEVGPNRACAEWLLRCGASLRWTNHKSQLKDYNSLPVGGPRLTIAEVDATDSAIMDIGFEHFKGCHDVRRVVLHAASYVDDEALRQLQYLRRSLQHLQVSSCGNVTDEGLRHLAKLSNLQTLLLYDFVSVKDKETVLRHLKQHLPQCAITFTYASSAEQEQQQRDREQKQREIEQQQSNPDDKT